MPKAKMGFQILEPDLESSIQIVGIVSGGEPHEVTPVAHDICDELNPDWDKTASHVKGTWKVAVINQKVCVCLDSRKLSQAEKQLLGLLSDEVFRRIALQSLLSNKA